MKGELEFPQWISEYAEILIRQMLNPEPNERIEINGIKQSKIYLKGKELFELKMEKSNTNKTLRTFNNDILPIKKPLKIEKEILKTDTNMFRKNNLKQVKPLLNIHTINIQGTAPQTNNSRLNKLFVLDSNKFKIKQKLKIDTQKPKLLTEIATTTNSHINSKKSIFDTQGKEKNPYAKLILTNNNKNIMNNKFEYNNALTNQKYNEIRNNINLDILRTFRFHNGRTHTIDIHSERVGKSNKKQNKTILKLRSLANKDIPENYQIGVEKIIRTESKEARDMIDKMTDSEEMKLELEGLVSKMINRQK